MTRSIMSLEIRMSHLDHAHSQRGRYSRCREIFLEVCFGGGKAVNGNKGGTFENDDFYPAGEHNTSSLPDIWRCEKHFLCYSSGRQHISGPSGKGVSITSRSDTCHVFPPIPSKANSQGI